SPTGDSSEEQQQACYALALANASINKQISRFETTAVYTHPDAKVDVVLVHGLNGDPQRTWTAKNDVFWPTDLLPHSLRNTRANILVYGYNADVYSKKHGVNPSDNFIFMHAQTLVTSLTHYRKDEQSSNNPIIWVCHSLGGILVKRALLYSNDLRASQHEDYRQIFVSTFGIIFLGTPHVGSDMGSWAVMLQGMSDAVVPKAFWHSESVLLKTLKRDNETLQNINNHFLDVYQRFKILMAHENHKTDLKGTKMLVVDAQSASPQLPGVTYFAIEATHSGMCKFESRNAPGYRTVAITIKEWAEEAPDVVSTRWRVEEEEKFARAQHEITERMQPWLKSQRAAQQAGQGSSTFSVAAPISTLPSPGHSQRGLRQSRSGHVLLPYEIEEFFESDSEPSLPAPEEPEQGPEQGLEPPSQESTSDTAPSRDPLFVKPSSFKPNTLFKGREREMKKLHKMLMDKERRSRGTSSVLIQSMPGGGKSHLARQYVFEHKDEYPGGVFWIRCKSLQELEYGYWDIARSVASKRIKHLDEVADTKKMVRLVHRWLSTNEDWLLVLDGVHFDYENLEDFIPFTKRTSIIYTSTEKTTPEDYQFDNPQVIALESLSAREAQELLLEEMGKSKPWNSDDLSRAQELVQLMERLPLMIHVAALHLKATREPLSKYLRSYRSRPKAGNLPAYRAVKEQLQHRGNVAALNLMSLLAFFGQHVPVEMIVLGIRALDKRTPMKTYDPQTRRSSLNSTLKVLIAFALIERNENDQISSNSGQSSRSVDMDQDSLDILRIHSIVQAFFIDTLADEKQAAFWLERAVRVFCHAFDQSDRRVREDSTAGLPEDYRRFLIHGKKLASCIERFERKYPELARKRSNDEEGSGEAPLVSVFERTSSSSEADSVSTPASNPSVLEWNLWDDNTTPLESPSVYSPGDYNPYHWHVTWPYGMPEVDDDSVSRTVTPEAVPTEIFESISVPDAYEPVNTAPTSSHRTVKRHVERRYLDHAGSWRASPQILSDPRVSLSRETVKGFISHTNTHGHKDTSILPSNSSRVTANSDAESTLNKISKVNPPPLREDGSPIFDMTRSPLNDADTPPVRPKLIAGRPSYTGNPFTEPSSPEEEIPIPTFSHVVGSYPAPSSSYTAHTIKRLKENDRPVSNEGLSPVRVSSPLAAEPLASDMQLGNESPVLQRTSPKLPSPPVAGRTSRPPSDPPSRTAHSSPSQYTGPFRPPPIPIEVNTSSALRTSPVSSSNSVRRLDMYSRPEPSFADISEESEQQLSQSVSSLRSQATQVPYPLAVPVHPTGYPPIAVHPAPWAAPVDQHPQGYSSQPMSRDHSHQSSSSTHSLPLPNSPSAQYRSSSPLARSPSQSPQIMQRPHSRRPSIVETEPSPQLVGFELETPPTSYSLYNESLRGRRRAESAVDVGGISSANGTISAGPIMGGGGGVYPGAISNGRCETKHAKFWSRLGRRGRSLGSQHRRTESAGGRLRRSPKVSPDLRGASGAFEAMGRHSIECGEAMSRTGSAGSGGSDWPMGR
ncbi:Protein SERAC1, partial [Apiospora sp. TS-2023a]